MSAPWPQHVRVEATRLAVALGFLTRLPVPQQSWDGEALARAQHYFPLAGIVLGALAGAAWWLASGFLASGVAAGLAIAILIVMSGALHEDGLADLADGLGAGGDRERALEIMRDSRIGSYGVIALVLSIGMRWATLAVMPLGAGIAALIVAPAIGRAAMVPVTLVSPPARSDGLGAALGFGATPGEAAVALGIALVTAVLLAGAGGVAALALGLVAGLGVTVIAQRRLGGYTGDVLGGVAVIAETAAFLVLAGALA